MFASSFPRRLLLSCASVFCIFALPVAAHAVDVLDRSLDGDGIRVLDSGLGADRVIANCPAADARQLLVMRENGNVISATRLLWDGRIDPDFGGPKRYGVDTLAQDTNGVALCRGDGSVWLAARRAPAGGDEDVLIMGLSAAGELIPGLFGTTHGVGRIDLDSYRNDLLDREEPLGFNHHPDGGALLTGIADTPAGSRPFIARFGGSGGLARVAFPEPQGFSGTIRATAAGVGPSNGIWVVGDGGSNGHRAFRMLLTAEDLAVVRTEAGAAAGIRTVGGGMIREGVMVVGATQSGASGPAEPRLLVFRAGETGFSMLTLPAAATLASGLATGLNAEGATVLPVPGKRVLFAIGAEAFEGTIFRGYKGWYFARAHIGNSAAEDGIDLSFGDGGQSVISVHSGDPTCVGKLNTQLHARVGHWQGRPTVVGTMKRRCDPDGDNDAVLLRLKATDALHDDGFE